MISFQQKGLEKGLTGMDNVAGGLIGIMGGGKPDVKNVMNVVLYLKVQISWGL